MSENKIMMESKEPNYTLIMTRNGDQIKYDDREGRTSEMEKRRFYTEKHEGTSDNGPRIKQK